MEKELREYFRRYMESQNGQAAIQDELRKMINEDEEIRTLWRELMRRTRNVPVNAKVFWAMILSGALSSILQDCLSAVVI